MVCTMQHVPWNEPWYKDETDDTPSVTIASRSYDISQTKLIVLSD